MLTTNPRTADEEPWDPDNPVAFIALAGSQFIRAGDSGTAVIRTRGGTEMTIYPGWVAVRIHGSEPGQVLFLTPEQVGDGAADTWSRT